MPPPVGPTHSLWTFNPNRTGRSVGVSIQVQDAQGTDVSTFERIHGKPMHLVVFPEDLSTVAEHKHPTRRNGTFTARLKLPSGGRFILFDEYDPAGPLPVTTDREVLSAGVVGPIGRPVWDFGTRERTVGGLTFRLTQDALMSGMGMPLTVDVTDAQGRPARLKGWPTARGPKGHMFAVQEGGPQLYHFHPSEADGGGHGGGGHGGGGHGGGGHGGGGHGTPPAQSPAALSFHAEVDQPGAYRVFLQVIKVGARKPIAVFFDVETT